MKTTKYNSKVVNILSRIIPIKSYRKKIRNANKYVDFIKKEDCEYYNVNENSFSQYGEDILIDKILKGLNIETPFYLDLGAHHPINLSNTHYFYIRNSTGINLEANPNNFDEFIITRPNDININKAICVNGGSIKYYMIKDNPALNTTSKEECDKYVAAGYELDNCIEVEGIDIETLYSDYIKGRKIDILSLDIEGYEKDILSELFKFIKPTILCVESFDHFGEYNSELDNLITSHGYSLEHINYYYGEDRSCNSIYKITL